jgi:hypothetical protein
MGVVGWAAAARAALAAAGRAAAARLCMHCSSAHCRPSGGCRSLHSGCPPLASPAGLCRRAGCQGRLSRPAREEGGGTGRRHGKPRHRHATFGSTWQQLLVCCQVGWLAGLQGQCALRDRLWQRTVMPRKAVGTNQAPASAGLCRCSASCITAMAPCSQAPSRHAANAHSACQLALSISSNICSSAYIIAVQQQELQRAEGARLAPHRGQLTLQEQSWH